LNAEQYGIYQEIMDAVSHRRPLCAFVDGKAGRGKTFLVNTICNKLRAEGHIVLPTATSAFAAQLYPGGKTTHSVFKVRPLLAHFTPCASSHVDIASCRFQ
ncbi:DNA helicase Pif1 like protein, partial [Daedaleopsis nitida]